MVIFGSTLLVHFYWEPRWHILRNASYVERSQVNAPNSTLNSISSAQRLVIKKQSMEVFPAEDPDNCAAEKMHLIMS